MIRLRDPQRKLWDSMIAQSELFELPEKLKIIDEFLDENCFLKPFLKHSKTSMGRATIPMERYLRLMYLKHERKLGYETLVMEVADSLTLRRFCRLDISEPVPHPTTLSRLTQRFGEETVAEIHSLLVAKLSEEGLIKGDRLRTDTTVMAAEVEHPTDAGLLADGVRVIGRTVNKLATVGREVGAELVGHFRNSTRTVKNSIWEIGRFLKKRMTAGGVDDSGAEKPSAEEKRTELLKHVNVLTAKVYEAAYRTVQQGRAVARSARRRAAHTADKTRLRVAKLCVDLVAWCTLTEKALAQTALRLAGQTSIPNRMISLFDPDARPIRRGKLSSPTEFGYKLEHTQVDGLIISDYKVHIGNPADKTLLVGVVERHVTQFGKAPVEVATDRGYHSAANEKALEAAGVIRVSSPACGKLSESRAKHQSQAWFKRGQNWRAGSEGSISCFKRKFGGDRTRLRGHSGASIWAGWGVIAHNLCKVPKLLAARMARSSRASTNAKQRAQNGNRGQRIW